MLSTLQFLPQSAGLLPHHCLLSVSSFATGCITRFTQASAASCAVDYTAVVADTALHHGEADSALYHGEADSALYHGEADSAFHHGEADSALYHCEADTALHHCDLGMAVVDVDL